MNLREEKGYALVITLIVIIFIFLFASLLMSSILNSRKQFNMSEERIRLIDIAEMGVIHYETKVANDINKVNEEFGKKEARHILIDQYAWAICSKILEKPDDQKVGIAYKYSIHVQSQGVNCKQKVLQGEDFTVNFTSTSLGEKEKVINGTITVKGNGVPLVEGKNNNDGGSGTKPSENNEWIKDLEERKNYKIVKNVISASGQEKLKYEGNTFFQGIAIQLSGQSSILVNGSSVIGGDYMGSGQNEFTIKGHTMFQKSIQMSGNAETNIYGNGLFKSSIQISGNAIIRVAGDADFYGTFDLKNHKTHICVNGKTYLKGKEQSQENSFPACKNWDAPVIENPNPGKEDPTYIFNLWGTTQEIKVEYYN